MSVSSAEKITRLTERECREWAQDPTVNPATGRDIEVGKDTYTAIAEHCKRAFGIEPDRRMLLPKTVSRWPVPRDQDAWVASMTRKKAVGLSDAVRKFGFITDTYVPDASSFVRIGKLLLEAEVLTGTERKAVEGWIATLNGAIVAPNKILATPPNAGDVYDYMYQIETMTNNTLLGVPTAVAARDLQNEIHAISFNNYFETGSLASSNRLNEMLIALVGLENEVVLQRMNPGAQNDAHAIPASRERSLPESISQRRVKQMKPRRKGANPEDPDEYYPWSATEEAAPTDRSRFRSHAKLSAMSPGLGGPEEPPMTPKKRTALLAELRKACSVMKDMISMQRFDRMNKKSLQLVVRLGAKRGQPESGKERCYYVRNLYQLWSAAAKSGAPFKDPLTREDVTDGEKAEIMSKVRRLRRDAPDLREPVRKADSALELSFNDIAVLVGRPQGASVGFYEVQLTREIGPEVYTVFDLGVIPSDIELADVDGDANLTSQAVIGNIQALFDTGRLLTSNVVPYQCCRVTLGRKPNYWTNDSMGSQMKNFINMDRWRLLATQVYDAL